MIRSVCMYSENGTRCNKVTRARRIHKFCRPHTLKVTGAKRPIPHQIKKVKVIKTPKVVGVPEVKGKKKR